MNPGFTLTLSRTASVNTDSQWIKEEACFACATAITTPVSLLANGFNVRSVLHGQVSLAAVNQIHVFNEAMNGCKNLKIH